MITVVVSAGRGPEEVRGFVADLAAWMLAHDPDGEQLEVAAGSVVLRLGAWVRPWLGTHELVDPVRGRGRRRRWFCTVASLVDPVLEPFDPDAIEVRADRSGGPGGQHVNTRSSAVRATYLPAGWTVRVAEERSQHRNRAEALRRLAAMHRARREERDRARRREGWRVHDRVQRGDPVRRWRRVGRRLQPQD
jgi:protein subunit release factor B